MYSFDKDGVTNALGATNEVTSLTWLVAASIIMVHATKGFDAT
jgi:hypothetical protein